MTNDDQKPGLKDVAPSPFYAPLINTCMLMVYRLPQRCSTQPLPLALDPIVSVCSELAHWALMVNGPQPFSQHTEAH